MAGWMGIVLALASLLLWGATGQRDTAVAGLGLASIVVIAALQRLRMGRALVVEVATAGRREVSWGAVYALTIGVRHRHARSLHGVELVTAATLPGFPHGAVLDIAPRHPGIWQIAVPCYQRGAYTVGPITWSISDAYAQFPLTRRVSTGESVLVMPQVVPLHRVVFAAAGRLPGDLPVQQRSEIPPTVATVREYQPGDPLGRVVWTRQTAQGVPYVRVFAPEVQVPVVIALDLPTTLTTAEEELLVTVAASLVAYYADRGAKLGLVLGGARLQVLAPDYGRGVTRRALQTLAVTRRGAHDVRQGLTRMAGVAIVMVVTTASAPAWQTMMTARSTLRWQVVTTNGQVPWSVPAVLLAADLAERKAAVAERAMRLTDTASAGEAQALLAELREVTQAIRSALEGQHAA